MKKVKVLSKNNMVFEETEIPKPNETRNILVKQNVLEFVDQIGIYCMDKIP